MAQDRINVYPAHFMPSIGMDEPIAVHSVGLSHLKEYLGIMYGGDMPGDVLSRRLSRPLFESMAALSTDYSLSTEALERDGPSRYVSNKVRLIGPVVDDAKRVGKYVGEELDKRETGSQVAASLEINGFTYMFGLFDLSSFVISSQLDLDHPRFQARRLIERSRGVMPAGHTMTEVSEEDKQAMERLIQSPLLKAAVRRRLGNLRHQGQKIIVNAESFAQRAIPLLVEEELRDEK